MKNYSNLFRRSQWLIPIAFAFSFSVLANNHAAGDDWPTLRGTDGRGNYLGSTVLSQANNIELEIRWKRQLGSGYSSVSVARDRCLTAYSDGTNDQLICLRRDDGETIWKVSLGPTFRGANGSFDGPLSTPLIYRGLVYQLGPRGEFFAVDLESGKVAWKRDLQKEEQAQLPLYGFSTTPVVAEDTICLLAGAKQGVMIGLDPKTGQTRWYAGKGQTASQIPFVYRDNERAIVFCGAGRKVLGIDPRDGKILFDFRHGGSNGTAMLPVPLPGSNLLFTNDDAFSKVFTLGPEETAQPGGQRKVSEKWTSRAIKNTYNVPVLQNGRLFAYSTRIFTCVDPDSGQALWKSRRPGDGFLIGVDDHLIVITKKGTLHVGQGGERQFQAKARLRVFDGLVWAIPAFADNSVYLRSFNEIACVDIVPAQGTPTVAQAKLPLGTNFRKFLQAVEQADSDKAPALIDQYLEKHDSFPIIEDQIAHFIYRGEARDLALACDVFGARQEEKMIRAGQTDLFYYAMKLPSDQRVSYIFLKDYQPIADPRNPRSMTSSMYAGEMEFAIRLRNEPPLTMSWFAMPDWKKPDWIVGDSSVKLMGQAKSESIPAGGDATIKVKVYTPPIYNSAKNRRFPVLYVEDGAKAQKLGDIVPNVDRLLTMTGTPQSILVLLESPAQRGALDRTKQLTEFVVPFIDKKYRTLADREHRAIYGSGFSAGIALSILTTAPDLFGGVAVQSPLVFDAARKDAIEKFQAWDRSTRIYLDWGKYDMNNPVENWDIRQMSKTIFDSIRKNDSLSVRGGEVHDSTDWGSWKFRFDKVLQAMFSD